MPTPAAASATYKGQIRDIASDRNSEVSGTSSSEDMIKWVDQSGAGHGPGVLTTEYAQFPGAPFQVTGTIHNGTDVVDGLTTTGRIVVGMPVDHASIPAGSTVLAITSGTAIQISSNGTGDATGAIDFNAINTPDLSVDPTDPVLVLGYNRSPSGADIEAGKGQAAFQIEAHYDRGAGGDVWMEAFFSFKGATAANAARPFFFAYDKETNKPQDVVLSAGTGQLIYLNHENYTGGASRTLTLTGSVTIVKGETVTQAVSGATGVVVTVSGSTTTLIISDPTGNFDLTNELTGSTSGALGANSVPTANNNLFSYKFGESIFDIRATTDARALLRLYSTEGRGSEIIMGYDGVDPNATSQVRLITDAGDGAGSIKTSLQMYNNDATPDFKSGLLQFHADGGTGDNTLRGSIGRSGWGGVDDFIWGIYTENAATSRHGLFIKAQASMTGALIETDGIDNAGTSIEASKWQLMPKGYITVKPSGGASSSPTTGASTITPAWTNKPGASTSGTATWFPMLSTTGALFWVPGFAD